MISNYPTFSKLHLDSRFEIEKITNKFQPYSDFNFISLYCWNVDDSAELAILNSNLIIKLPDYLTNELVCSIIGTTNIDETLEILFESMDAIRMVPKAVVDCISAKEKYSITEERESFDYIYKATDLAHMDGPQYKKKRNKINQVQRSFKDTLTVTNTMTLKQAQKVNMLHLFDEWASSDDEAIKIARAERKALSRLLEKSDKLNIIVTLLTLDKQLIGFSINELLENNHAICHFEKALKVHDHIYSYLAQVVAIELRKHGIMYINWEQDLGIEGLRKSKLSYYPYEMLEKFTIELAA